MTLYLGWTPQRVQTLKGLLSGGMSAAEIACELGGITRNAVIGKVLRLGLELPGRRIVLTPEQIEARRQAKMAKRRLRRSGSGNQNIVRRVEVSQERREPRPPRERPSRQSQVERTTAAQARREQLAFLAATELTDLPPEDAAAAVHFHDLNRNNCRWPIGDPRSLETIKFCGKEPRKGSYCAHHDRVAHR